MHTLDGKVALVTGGGRGIGAAVVRRLARDGAEVAFTFQDDARSADALVDEVTGDGGRATAVRADSAEPRRSIANQDRAPSRSTPAPPTPT